MINHVKTLPKRLGMRIRIERVKNDISQAKLAELAQINRTTLGKIEHGKTSTTIETMAKIANALNLSLMELVNLDFTR